MSAQNTPSTRSAQGAQGAQPHLVVVRGEPTAEEIAALTAVLAARAAAARAAANTPAAPERPSAWRDRAR
ncbi:acyl-CoA carboxylase epsilon subunit, partial [Nocardiopsis protaetiae]|uniref:acyl-CoA carboxylase epsilon subunit n=1 Tax=Nocardiopsis protaetiae TaxID=3382270 RepID=UPI00387AD58E